MMKNRYLSALLIISLLCFFSAACSKDSSVDDPVSSSEVYETDEGLVDEDGDLVEQEPTGISFEEEDEDAQLVFVEKNPSAFFGDWTATSDHAVYLYGNVDITVNPEGTWIADITGEKLVGHWEKQGDHLHMDDDGDLFDFDLSFESSGKLILIETGEDDSFSTVLTRK